ncbi:OprD family porin [Halopseudomonas yangmingensis]|uniref:Outer membrane porin, OprD family n=1 Tax=Halopseudomonas yangmingensis TaxID=1720063 RepID=A0A1I4NG25_9GAMM|nr:OprD family porin [Halopseudomonas yangmingensis]SFM14494.1 outer membrane porin, OprD family [Halopseudomonas yangmingensis]
MKNTVKWSSIALAVAMGNAMISSQAVAGEGFVEGASATLSNRTVYFNRDFRNAASGDQSKAEETGTGFLLNFESGFTEGPIGLGADVVASAGFKVDSGKGRTGTRLLEMGNNGRANSEYSEIRGAVKANILGDTTLRYGVHFPENPVVAYEDARLLPQHYQGYSITNSSIDGLFVEAGRMNKRGEMDDSSESSKVSAVVADANKVTYLGGTYAFAENLSASLYTSKMDKGWKRHFLGATHTADLGNGLSLTSDLAHYHTSDDSPSGNSFQNKASSLAFTLGAGHHAVTAAYQRMSGDAGFVYDDGAIFLANSVQVLDFEEKNERSWQARYDYDFEGLGIPGLSFMTRYVRGSNIDMGAGNSDGKRWERNSELRYTVQNGMLEGVNVRWRNATVRQGSVGSDIDENLLIVSYTWNLL